MMSRLVSWRYLLPAIIVIYFSYLSRAFQVDDALIYLRYIRNFVEGHGLVYNPGEKFNGLTSPLFSYFILIGSLITHKYQFVLIASSGFFLFLTSIVASKLIAETKAGQLLTAVAIASFGYFYSTFGLETTMFVFLICLSLYLYDRGSDVFVIALALTVITRSEGIFLAAVLGIDYLIRYRKLPNLKIVGIAAVVFAVPFIFNFFYYGHFLPATGSAKILQGKSGYWGEHWIFLQFTHLLQVTFHGKKLVALAFIVMALYGAYTRLNQRLTVLCLAFVFLLGCFYVGLNIPNYHHYYAPFCLFLIIFAAAGVERLVRQLWPEKWISDRGFLAAFALGVTALAVSFITLKGPGGRPEAYYNIGVWLKANTEPDATVGLVEIGTVGWYSDRFIIDILGLTNKYNADFIGQRDPYSWLTKYQPDYILRHSPPWGMEVSTTMLENAGAYVKDTRFDNPSYVLLKKNTAFPDSEIAALAGKTHQSMASFSYMAAHASVGPPWMLIEPDRLFAHAPAEATYQSAVEFTRLHIGYGIKKEAEGLHSGVCFEIANQQTAEVVFRDCIEKETAASDMRRAATLDVSGKANSRFTFKTICETTCENAWSYWDEVWVE